MSLIDRATFNLLMVERGWAASFPIYPSIPSFPNLVLLRKVAKDAIDKKKGMWADPMTLTGYEFKMCVRLYQITKRLLSGEKVPRRERYGWISRYCVDMLRTTSGCSHTTVSSSGPMMSPRQLQK